MQNFRHDYIQKNLHCVQPKVNEVNLDPRSALNGFHGPFPRVPSYYVSGYTTSLLIYIIMTVQRSTVSPKASPRKVDI